MQFPTRPIRVAGYILITIAVACFITSAVSEWLETPHLWVFPILVFCGVGLTRYKEKEFPFSRTESIFAKAFRFVVVILVVLSTIIFTVSKVMSNA